jgi:K+-transporting ATPase ATPase A chain
MVLVLSAIAMSTDRGLASIYNPAAHGFSEAFYAYDSQSNNNGSAFAGYGATEFSTLMGSLALWLGRFAPLVAALAWEARWPRRPCRRPPAPSAPTARPSRSSSSAS